MLGILTTNWDEPLTQENQEVNQFDICGHIAIHFSIWFNYDFSDLKINHSNYLSYSLD